MTVSESRKLDSNETETEAPMAESGGYQKVVLRALNVLNRHVYAGTVSDKTKAKRRAANKVARQSRRANR